MKQLTLFQRMIQEQENQLFLKNYTEKMIGSTALPGLFIRQLKTGFAEAIQDRLWDAQPLTFDTSMTGHFPRQATVQFRFTFRYDPAQLKLQLTKLRATLNDTFQVTYAIDRPHRDLPPAGTVHEALIAAREKTPSPSVQTASPSTRKRSVRSTGPHITHS
jgi:hypothetical protein